MTDDSDSGADADGSDTDLRAAVDQYLDDADAALSEYDSGYADADATLQVLRSHLDDLRASVDED